MVSIDYEFLLLKAKDVPHMLCYVGKVTFESGLYGDPTYERVVIESVAKIQGYEGFALLYRVAGTPGLPWLLCTDLDRTDTIFEVISKDMLNE